MKICPNCGSEFGDELTCKDCGIGLAVDARSYTGQYTTDPAFLTKLLKIMLYLSLGIIIVSIIFDIMQLNLLNGGYFTSVQADANDARQRSIGILYIITFIVTGITFLKWIYRANSNCRGFGAHEMRFTPGWSIGSYFIPLLNLYRPYQAMKEIWKVSKNPAAWQNQDGSAILGWWWALWITSEVLGRASFTTTMSAQSIEALITATHLSIASSIVTMALHITALLLVSAIYTMQEAWKTKNSVD